MPPEITVVYSEPDADPETATVLLDGDLVIFLARGDDETHDLLVKLASNARVVGEAFVAYYEKKLQQAINPPAEETAKIVAPEPST